MPRSGPPQRGDRAQGQYILIKPQPIPELVAQTGVKQPSSFDRTNSGEMVAKCLAECGIEEIQQALFPEPRANGDPNLNTVAVEGGRISGSSIRPCLSAWPSWSWWQHSRPNANNHDTKT